MKLKKGKYRPVNQAGFRSIWVNGFAKPRKGKFRRKS